MRFSGKTVVITGAASGIGKASAELFAREGATVYAADIDIAAGESLAAGSEGAIRFQHCDVTSTEAIRALTTSTTPNFGALYGFENNLSN